MEISTASHADPAGVVGAARASVGELAETLWAAAEPGTLIGMIEELEQLRSLVASLEVRVAVEIEASEAAKAKGWVSSGDYLTHAAGARKGHGSRLLRTGRGLCSDRTATLDALTDGRISPEHAEVIVTVVGLLPSDLALRDEAEAVLLEHATKLDATDLRRAADLLLELLDPDGVAARQEAALERAERSAHLGRFLAFSDDGLGGVRLKGRGTTEDAAIVKAALAALAGPRPSHVTGTDLECGSEGRDLRDHGARTWDALVETCLKAQEADGLLPEQHGAKPRITLTLPLSRLTDGLGPVVLDTGERISVAALRRLACDAEVIPAVLGSQGEVLDVGRTARLVTPGIWKALVVRDAHCAFPGCRRQPLACDAHHLMHWADGGPTSLGNLVLLCRAHHTLIHATPWQARINPTDWRPEFRAPPAHHRLRPHHPPEHPPDDDGWIREMRR